MLSSQSGGKEEVCLPAHGDSKNSLFKRFINTHVLSCLILKLFDAIYCRVHYCIVIPPAEGDGSHPWRSVTFQSFTFNLYGTLWVSSPECLMMCPFSSLCCEGLEREKFRLIPSCIYRTCWESGRDNFSQEGRVGTYRELSLQRSMSKLGLQEIPNSFLQLPVEGLLPTWGGKHVVNIQQEVQCVTT